MNILLLLESSKIYAQIEHAEGGQINIGSNTGGN